MTFPFGSWPYHVSTTAEHGTVLESNQYTALQKLLNQSLILNLKSVRNVSRDEQCDVLGMCLQRHAIYWNHNK